VPLTAPLLQLAILSDAVRLAFAFDFDNRVAVWVQEIVVGRVRVEKRRAENVITVQENGVLVTGNDFQRVNGTIVALPINLGPPAQQVYLVLYGTGIAKRSSIANVTVSVGGLALPVAFAGAEGEAGLDQINVLLPASLAGLGNTTITIVVDDSVSNTASVTIM
jgi:uncharacterized protein (TIGR03437 family)